MTYLPAVIGMVLLHGLFVATEYAFVKAASIEVRLAPRATYRKDNEDIFRNLENYLMACQIGKIMALMSTGVFLGLEVGYAGPDPGMGFSTEEVGLLAFGFLTVVLIHVVIGFEFPKKLGIMKNDLCVDKLSGFLVVSRYALFPVIWVAKQLTK